MGETGDVMQWKIIIAGLKEATNDIETLKRKLSEVQTLRDKAFQKSLQTGDRKAYDQLGKIEADLYKKRQRLEADSARQKDRQFRKEQAQIESLGNRYKRLYDKMTDSNTKMTAKQFNSFNRQFTEIETKMEMLGASPVRRNPLYGFSDYQSYSRQFSVPFIQQIREANNQADMLYQTWMRTGREADRINFERAATSFRMLTRQGEHFNNLLGLATQRTGYLGSLAQKLRSHFNWILAGGLIGMSVGAPTAFIGEMAQIEKGMAGMEQVLAKPQDIIDKLKKSIKELGNEDLSKLTDSLDASAIDTHKILEQLTQDIITIASDYGEKIPDVIESTKLWGRAYKDLEVVQTMARASSKLAVADSFDLITANKALESSVMQWRFQIKNANDALVTSNRIIDSWTNLAHNYTVSAQTLATANERMASAAKLVGVNFDFAQALVAVMARKTQAGGAQIGNALKSIFASIHSDKAIKEIEKLGVAVYQVADDGTKKFRNVEDVLMDVMLKTQDTKHNLESLFKSMAGGKWQWNKMGAVVDYEEFIKALNLSLYSQGMASKQVEMQMDTLVRKFQTLKNELSRMAASSGGAREFFKDILDTVTRIIRILNNMPGSTAHILFAIGAFKMLTIVIRRTVSAFSSLLASNTMMATTSRTATVQLGEQTVAVTALANATNQATSATQRLGIAGAIASKLNPILAIISTITLAWGIYESMTNKVNNSLDKSSQHLDNLNVKMAAQQAQLKNVDRNIPYIDKLTRAIRTLNKQLANTKDAEKRKKINNEIEITEKTLANITSEAAVKNMRSHKYNEESVNKEKEAYEKSKDSIKESLKKLRDDIYKTSIAVAKQCDEQIKSINNEATSFDAAANAIEKALGKIDKLMFEYYRGKSKYMNDTADVLKEVEKDKNMPWYARIGWSMYTAETGISSSDQARELAKEANKNADKIAEDAKRVYNNKKLELIIPDNEERARMSGGNSGIIEEDGKKKHGNSSIPPRDLGKKFERDSNKLNQNNLFTKAKLSADRKMLAA